MDDLMIIELYFARDEQAIEETDTKYENCAFIWRTISYQMTRMQKNVSMIHI